jgi:hypothetical protein
MIKLIDILIEVKTDSNLLSTVKAELDKLGLSGKRESKHGTHLRYDIGDESEVMSILQKIMKNNKIPTSKYKIEVIDVNDYKSGGKSGSFKTYKLTSGGEEVFIVNNRKEKSSISGKSLTPTKLGLSGKEFSNVNSLISSVESNLKSQVKELLVSLMNDVNKNTKKTGSDKLENFKETITLSPNTISLSAKINESDVNTIGKDFGEILGSILLFNKVKNPVLSYPSGNAPLIDFIINDYKVSSKYKGGAAATLTSIINGIDPKSLKKQSQKELYKIFEIVVNNKVSSGYLEVAKYLNIPGMQELAKITGIPVENMTTENLNQFVAKKTPEKALKLLNGFYSAIGRGPKDSGVNWDKISKNKYYGIIVGPLSYAVTDYLNAKGTYRAALKEMLSKIEVKQLYLDINLGKSKLDFNLKSFSDSDSDFTFEAPNQSVYNPDNGRLGFKLK